MERVKEQLQLSGCTIEKLDRIKNLEENKIDKHIDEENFNFTDLYVYLVGNFCYNYRTFTTLKESGLVNESFKVWPEFYKEFYKICIQYHKWSHTNTTYVHNKYTSEQVEYVINYLSSREFGL